MRNCIQLNFLRAGGLRSPVFDALKLVVIPPVQRLLCSTLLFFWIKRLQAWTSTPTNFQITERFATYSFIKALNVSPSLSVAQRANQDHRSAYLNPIASSHTLSTIHLIFIVLHGAPVGTAAPLIALRSAWPHIIPMLDHDYQRQKIKMPNVPICCKQR